MKKLITFIFVLLLFCASAFADWTYYDGFETGDGHTLNDVYPAPTDTCSSAITMYNSASCPKLYCDQIIGDATTTVYDTTITPRYGSQFWYMSCDATHDSLLNDSLVSYSQRSHAVYGRNSGWSPCNAMKFNDGTEYWIGFSLYIPDHYATEYQSSMFYEVISQGVIPAALYYGSQIEYFYLRFWYEGGYHSLYTTQKWTDLKGTWTDWVIHARWYDASNPSSNALVQVYLNGVVVYNHSTAGGYNSVTASTSPYSNSWVQYNTSAYPQVENRYLYMRLADTGDIQGDPWRVSTFDEIRMTEQSAGSGTYNYCSVAPPIWPSTPTITFPTDGATGINTYFTALFNGCNDHRADPQGCFAAYHTQVQVDESGGDWSTPVYDSGSVSAESSQAISGLSASTAYQMRVRHSSYNSDTSTEYWGSWSSTSFSTTGAAEDPVVAISVTDSTSTEEGATTGTIRVTCDPTCSSVSVNFDTIGTATLGVDYTLSESSPVTVNGTYADITVTPIDDYVVDPGETAGIQLSSGTGYNIGSPSNGSVSITDNDTGVTFSSGINLSGGISFSGSAPAECTESSNLIVDLTTMANSGSQPMSSNALGQTFTVESGKDLYAIRAEFNGNVNCVASLRIGPGQDLSSVYYEEWASVAISDGNVVHTFVSTDNDNYPPGTYYIGFVEASGVCVLRYDNNNPYSGGTARYVGASGWDVGTANTARDYKISVVPCQ